MPSQRNTIENANDSKNTRMDMEFAFSYFNFRKDEIMHLGRYFKAAQEIADMSNSLKRPVRVLDVGCGEMNTMRLLYKSYREKKSGLVECYHGVDIDYKMVQSYREKYQSVMDIMSADFIIQDLTVNPQLPAEDGFYDVVISFEFLEHIQPQFAPSIIGEMYRVVRTGGGCLLVRQIQMAVTRCYLKTIFMSIPTRNWWRYLSRQGLKWQMRLAFV